MSDWMTILMALALRWKAVTQAQLMDVKHHYIVLIFVTFGIMSIWYFYTLKARKPEEQYEASLMLVKQLLELNIGYNCSKTVTHGGGTACLDVPLNNLCIVYSIGVGYDWAFDSYFGRKGCEVHSFDPTVILPTLLDENVHFHYLGLGGNSGPGDLSGKFTHPKFGRVDDNVEPLAKIMSDLGHDHLDILKVDCEGCEWPAFEQIAQHKPDLIDSVKQILVELHFSVTLGIPSKNQISSMGTLYKFLIKDKGFKMFFHRKNPGNINDREILIDLVDVGVPVNNCCLEIGFVNPKFFGAN